MLDIKFKTDEDIIARVIISKKCAIPTDFANYLWDKYKISYMLLRRDFMSNEINKDIILELKQQKFFKIYFDESKKNLERIRSS